MYTTEGCQAFATCVAGHGQGVKHSGAIAETLLTVCCVSHLEDHVQQHIKPCLPRVFGGNVGWREIKHIGPCLSADCMYQHLLAHSSWEILHGGPSHRVHLKDVG